MDAGVVAYKLCDLEFKCDQCPFDAVMRKPVFGASDDTPARPPAAIPTFPDGSLERYFASFEPVRFPGDRVYVPGHLWVRNETDSSITLGIDHVAATLVGSLAAVVLPHHPTHLVRHAPCCWLVHHEGTIGLSSPFDGMAVMYNAELTSHPELVAERPYTDGWIIKAIVDPEVGRTFERRSASENAAIVGDELLQLRADIANRVLKRPDIGPSAMDGGFLIRSPFELIGPAAFAMIAKLFSV
jgi:glycine cleavage system H protein